MRHITISILNAILVGIIILYYSWLSFSDISEFVEFEYITFKEKTEQGLVFTSKFETKQDGHYKFSDRLICNGVQVSTFRVDIPSKNSHPMEERTWMYQADAGTGVCHLEATTCVQLPFDIAKCVLIKSNVFNL